MSTYLKNAWYVAALSPEVGRTLKPVRLLSESIVLYLGKFFNGDVAFISKA